MKIITRATALKNLKKYIGQDLMALASDFGITTFKEGKQNKGWKGLVLERLAGLENDNKKAPNGLGFELKSVAFVKDSKTGKLKPKETMAITMINPKELEETPFLKSHCWEKLKSLVFCAVLWDGHNAQKAILLDVESLDFSEDDEIIRTIEADYEFIRKKLKEDGFRKLTGAYGKLIQPRTKGAGHGSISRAFYARKELVQKIFDLGE